MQTIKKDSIRAAIFDVDGTLLDTMPTWHNAGERYLATIGVKAEPGLGDILFAETTESGSTYIIDHYRLNLSREEVSRGIIAQMEEYYRDEAQPKEGAVEFLETLKQAAVPMAVVTSTEGSCIRDAFARLDLSDYFTVILSAQDLGTTKKEPAIWTAASEAMGVNPKDTWVFEDGLYAVDAANSFGYHTAGLYDIISEADQPMIRAHADVYLNSFTELTID